jgi:hypothetical protein
MDQPQLIREQGTKDFLHRFFSPYKVPAELTEEEIQICVRLYPRKNKLSKQIAGIHKRETYVKLLKALEANYMLLEGYRESYSKVFGEAALRLTPEDVAYLTSESDTLSYFPVSLPPELVQDPITRESFSEGIVILIAQMEQLERTL